MGKTAKWIKNFLTGKKDRSNCKVTAGNEVPATLPKEKKRWSFRRSSAGQNRDLNSAQTGIAAPNAKQEGLESEKHALAVAAATAAAADAAAAAAKAAVAVIQLTSAASCGGGGRASAAATKIQAVFRGYLARKALNALKGIVKLQALIRGHLVRKQAAATLRCMQALITAQARARAQRLKMAAEDQENLSNQRLSVHRKSRHSYQEYDRGMEDNIKIVEMDLGVSRGNQEPIFSTYNGPSYPNHEAQHISPPPSHVTDQSPRTFSAHFDDYSFWTPQSSPHCYSAISRQPDQARTPISYATDSLYHEYPFYPSYMANTESSRAKVRSHSAPRQRPETLDRQPSRRRPSIEGRNLPRAVRMQRSSSHMGSTAQNYHYYPVSIKLDKSNISLKESECGSTCSVVTTNTMYSRPVVGFEVQGNRY